MTYFKLLELREFNLVPAQMKKWPLVNWVVFWINVGIALSILTVLGICYTEAKVQWYYLGLFFLIMACIVLPGLIWRKTHHVHVHHYNVGMIFLVLIAYQNAFLAIFSGCANGWLVEGSTVYAFDAVFKRREDRVAPKSISQVSPDELTEAPSV